MALDADRPPVLDQEPARLDPGPDPRAGRRRPWQVADVHAALGIDPAAERAGAALDAVAGVTGDRPSRGPDRRRSLHRQLAVATHPLGVQLGDPQELLGFGEVGIEIARPGDAVLIAPVVEHRGRRPEAGAGVDHRGAADHPRDGDRDRWVSFGDRQAGVAVEGGDRVEVALGIGVAVVVAAGLQDDYLEARLGEHRRGGCAARAGADDDDVAFLALAARRRVSERPRGLWKRAVGEAAAGFDPDLLLDLGDHRVAQRREDLCHQQQLVVEPEARLLHAAQEVVAGSGAEVAEAPGERQPLEGPQAELDAGQHPRRDGGKELGHRAGDVDVTLGGRQPVDAGPHRLADRAQSALLGG